jgi:hypothetical protein
MTPSIWSNITINTFQSLKKSVKGKKIVNKIFYIKGDDIFDVSFCPGLVEKSQRFHVKSNPINEEQNRVVSLKGLLHFMNM